MVVVAKKKYLVILKAYPGKTNKEIYPLESF